MCPVTFGLVPDFFYFIDPDPQGQESDGNIADAHDDSCTDAPQAGKPLQGPQDRDTEYENTAEINNQGGFRFPKTIEEPLNGSIDAKGDCPKGFKAVDFLDHPGKFLMVFGKETRNLFQIQ